MRNILDVLREIGKEAEYSSVITRGNEVYIVNLPLNKKEIREVLIKIEDIAVMREVEMVDYAPSLKREYFIRNNRLNVKEPDNVDDLSWLVQEFKTKQKKQRDAEKAVYDSAPRC